MTELKFIAPTLGKLSDEELMALASDMCDTIQLPSGKRTITHLFPVDLTCLNKDAVYFWLDSNKHNLCFPYLYRDACFELMRHLENLQNDWDFAF